MITKRSAGKIVRSMMGLWFLDSEIAEYIAAFLTGNSSAEQLGLTQHQSVTLLYTDIMWVAFAGAALTLVLTPLLNRWMWIDDVIYRSQGLEFYTDGY